jgi:hypothetical protein
MSIDDQNYFEALFGGHNQYRFTKVLPEVGHSYMHEIIMNAMLGLLTTILAILILANKSLFG